MSNFHPKINVDREKEYIFWKSEQIFLLDSRYPQNTIRSKRKIATIENRPLANILIEIENKGLSSGKKIKTLIS